MVEPTSFWVTMMRERTGLLGIVVLGVEGDGGNGAKAVPGDFESLRREK
jgi:hypothetical protein